MKTVEGFNILQVEDMPSVKDENPEALVYAIWVEDEWDVVS